MVEQFLNMIIADLSIWMQERKQSLQLMLANWKKITFKQKLGIPEKVSEVFRMVVLKEREC